ncbi:MAG: sulfotransferase family protein [Gemmataceae bacterium]
MDAFRRLINGFPQVWKWLGTAESALLGPKIARYTVTKPIYICGLARAGSTLLHEVISSHPYVATHRIKDYPFVSTPYWWRRATAFSGPTEARERPHRDRMMITSESPDAIEEMLWIAFFPNCHDPAQDNCLSSANHNAAFDTYYVNHLRKLLAVENATRYAAKANYHVARLGYILSLFPDAKFVIPVRAPTGHIASLVRQHHWFSEGHRQSPRSLAVMRHSGHFEFGLDRRPLNLGNRSQVRRVEEAWQQGHEVRGWSYYWDMVYRYLADLLDAQPAIRNAAIVVRFEELCAAPATVLRRVLEHCELSAVTPLIQKFAPAIRRPDYYQNPLNTDEIALIRAETAATARRWGVADPTAPQNSC